MSKIDYTIFDTIFAFTADATVVCECESSVIVYENLAAKNIQQSSPINLVQLAQNTFGVHNLSEIGYLPSFKETKMMVAEVEHILPHIILYLQLEIRQLLWETQSLFVLSVVDN